MPRYSVHFNLLAVSYDSIVISFFFKIMSDRIYFVIIV